MHSGETESFAPVLDAVGKYYTEKITLHGPVPQGVDWKDGESQTLRFQNLLTICGSSNSFSLNDLGCGYGGLAHYLRGKGWTGLYHGADISKAMIDSARLAADSQMRFYDTGAELPNSEYSVSSGVFNVKLDHSTELWEAFILSVLDLLHSKSTIGFAVNMLTSYSDIDRQRPGLFYASPEKYFQLCKTRYSPHICLLHDYGLYEFTLLVRKVL